MILLTAIIIFTAAGYLYLICPSLRSRHENGFSKSPIAHRGLHDRPDVDENSAAAFRLAAERGLAIEFDVRLTRDSVPVVMHDSSLSRMCGIDGVVSGMTLEELRKCKLKVSGESIPTLSEILDLIDGRVPLLIELKGERLCPVAEKTAEVMEAYRGEYAVESFNPLYIYRYRKIAPEVTRGILAEHVSGGKKRTERLLRRIASALLFNFLARPDFIAYRYSDGIGINMKLCRILGAEIAAWTVRRPDEYADACERYDWVIGENIPEETRENL